MPSEDLAGTCQQPTDADWPCQLHALDPPAIVAVRSTTSDSRPNPPQSNGFLLQREDWRFFPPQGVFHLPWICSEWRLQAWGAGSPKWARTASMPASTSSCSIFRRTHYAYRWLQSIISVELAVLGCCLNTTAALCLQELQRIRLQRQQAIGTSIIIWSLGVFGILLAYAAWVRHHSWLSSESAQALHG